MNTIYNILLSDGAVVLHFLLTMILVAVVILRGIHSEVRLHRMLAENFDLKRQLCELSDFTSSSFQDVRRKADLQSDVICHTVDYVTGTAELDTSLIAALYNSPARDENYAGAELLAVDIVSEPVEPDMSTAESAFVTPDPNHLEPDVTMPLRASMITIAADVDDSVEFTESAVEERSDVMTRVLQQSRRR